MGRLAKSGERGANEVMEYYSVYIPLVVQGRSYRRGNDDPPVVATRLANAPHTHAGVLHPLSLEKLVRSLARVRARSCVCAIFARCNSCVSRLGWTLNAVWNRVFGVRGRIRDEGKKSRDSETLPPLPTAAAAVAATIERQEREDHPEPDHSVSAGDVS